jgi:hypothetical protein
LSGHSSAFRLKNENSLRKVPLHPKLIELGFVSDLSRMQVLEELTDDSLYPAGAFLEPDEALEVIENFFIEPKTLPGPITWMDAKHVFALHED